MNFCIFGRWQNAAYSYNCKTFCLTYFASECFFNKKCFLALSINFLACQEMFGESFGNFLLLLCCLLTTLNWSLGKANRLRVRRNWAQLKKNQSRKQQLDVMNAKFGTEFKTNRATNSSSSFVFQLWLNCSLLTEELLARVYSESQFRPRLANAKVRLPLININDELSNCVSGSHKQQKSCSRLDRDKFESL